MRNLKTLAISLLVLLFAGGCSDEEFVSLPLSNETVILTRGTPQTSALTQNGSGQWVASRRVPLVGKGRIVDDISDALVAVLGNNGGFENLLDTDLDNVAKFNGVADVNVLGNQLASVRDLNHVYAGGQAAGFVYKVDNTGLLTANVLKGFWLKTFLNGVEQESKGGNTEGNTLELNLLSVANNDGKQALSISTGFSKPFDEIKIGMAGISADVVNAFSLYYAFVGENEIKPCTTGSVYFPDSEINWDKTPMPGIDLLGKYKKGIQEVVNANLTDGFKFGLLGNLLTDPTITVNLNEEVTTGSEIGFYTSSIDVLSINLGGGIELTTLDGQGNQVETTEIKSLLGVSAVAGGGSQISLVTTKPCSQIKIKFKGVNISISSTTVHYAFVRDPIEVDASSYFSLSDVTISGNSYHLSAPAGGNTSWTILEFPSGANPVIKDNKITGMTVDGDYKISGTFTDEKGNSITQTMVITRKTTGMGENCNQIIGTEYKAEAYMPSGGGSLITLDQIKGYQNLVDDNPDNYATYTTLLSLAANRPIMGIKTNGKNINADGQKVKAGFVMQTSRGLLGTDVLKFFVVKLYKDNQEVASSVADGNNVVDVGLIGNKGNKVRIGITTEQEFNKIELWTAGVLNLNLEQFRLYNAYWELADAGCVGSDPAEACIELLTPAAHGAEINYAETKTDALASVGNSFNNLGNLLDADIETGALIVQTGNVVGATTVAVKFDEVTDNTKSTPIGFILKHPTGLADVNVLKATVLKIYHKGVEVGSTAEGGVLGLDVIGYTERIFIETTPVTTAFDEVRITFPSAVGLLNNVILSGVYIRRDSDGDGIPDCAEDEDEGGDTSNITDAKVRSEHICTPEDIVIEVTGGTAGANYTLVCYNYAAGNTTVTKDCILMNGTFTLSGMPAGDYYITVQEGDETLFNGIHAAVHPQQTTWKTGASGSDWNDWNNWTDGAPWGCTNVIIPSGCANYPVLEKNVDNYCANIHFCAGAEVVNTHYLNYDLAWVELSITPGRYYMLSAPLKEMVTGDVFIPRNMNGNHGTETYFTSLNAENAVESRFTPRVYQRLWSSNATGKTIGGDVTVTPDATNWTPPFNALNQRFEPGMGFSLKAGETGASATYTFRFPKQHETYTYVDGNGVSTGITENITRTAVSGRFIYEAPGGNAPSFPYTVTVRNQKAGNTFIAGNPFMAHIDIKKFMQANPSVRSMKVYDGNTNNSLILADGQLLGTDRGFEHIAPMQSFFVTVEGDATELSLKYTEEMLMQKPGANLFVTRNGSRAATRSASRSVPAASHTLRLSAYCEGTSADCLVRIRPTASDSYRPGEDSKLLIDNEVVPQISVFTEADGKALDIQQIRNRTEIPVGFSLKRNGRVSLTLSHAADSEWNNWVLVDKQTGKHYPLDKTDTWVDLGDISTHAGRFCLMKNVK